MTNQAESKDASENRGSSQHDGAHGNLPFFIIDAIVLALAIALILPTVLKKESALSIFHGIGIGPMCFCELR